MRTLHLDAFAGVSGDMWLGALLDLGLPLAELNTALGALKLKGLRVTRRRVRRGALTGTQARVRVPDAHHPHRGLREIARILRRAALPAAVRDRALDVFTRLGRAEARLHGVPLERIHFHEVGALDAIADVVGVCWGLRRLGVDRVIVSAVNVGSGVVGAAHGSLPVPAPAALELLKHFSLYAAGPAAEHTTPTGAALLAALAAPAQETEAPLRLEAVGYGAGSRDWPEFPNLLRARLSRAAETQDTDWDRDRVTVLTANLDDVSPQVLGFALERLLAAGALDVSLQPIQMKKNRGGTRFEVICRPEHADALARIVFRETATLGLRIAHHERLILKRRVRSVLVGSRRVRVKQGFLGSVATATSPEYEDARACALATGRTLNDVYESARRKARTLK